MKYCIIIIILLISFISCNNNKSKRSWTDEEDLTSSELIQSNDSCEQNVNISKYETTNAEEIKSNLQSLEANIIEINSPDKLMECKQNIDLYLSHTVKAISMTPDSNEKKGLETHYKNIKKIYEKKVLDYSLPANGIIQNIKIQTQRLESCSSKADLLYILDTHYSYFKNLPKIHIIVEEKNRQSEVRELASKLQQLFYEKIATYNVDFH